MTDDRIGQRLSNYRLIRLLGEGGFAKVYLGEHVYLKSHAALKILKIFPTKENLENFLVEAQRLARLTHPRIVRILDFTLGQGPPYLIMEYAPGGTLRKRHPRGSRLSLSIVVPYVKQIAAALQYAHSKHFIHRDVKPENFLLGENDEVLLSDFGVMLFCPVSESLSTQEMAGTVPYMACEQMRGKPCYASDQYALATVVYEWLCGVCPFSGSQWEIINQQLDPQVLPVPLRTRRPELSLEVEEVVLRALVKDPQKRFASVQMFAEALEHASQLQAQ